MDKPDGVEFNCLPAHTTHILLYNHPMDSTKTYQREDAIGLLRRNGIGLTRQRADIAQVLFFKHQHLSADQIQAQVNSSYTYASKATVYNTLRLFLEKGLVREVLVDSSKVFYDSNTEAHHHFYDVTSGELSDIAADLITVSNLPKLPKGMIAEGVDVVIRVRSASSLPSSA